MTLRTMTLMFAFLLLISFILFKSTKLAIRMYRPSMRHPVLMIVSISSSTISMKLDLHGNGGFINMFTGEICEYAVIMHHSFIFLFHLNEFTSVFARTNNYLRTSKCSYARGINFICYDPTFGSSTTP